ncbi:MAG: glycerol kinase GlpK [Propionibacteriaceae bacterium]|nr:glycerol kinase GlpK [Propionibacteriaceae bacterium]
MTSQYVLAIDQGTTSTRALIFDHDGRVKAHNQTEHRQIFPNPGWVEHDPIEIMANVRQVIAQAMKQAGLQRKDIAAIGVTNQRETAVIWDRTTGKPIHNAIVWQDTRTDQICQTLAGSEGAQRYKAKVGLPLATYFSGPKWKWLLENVPSVQQLPPDRLLAGTIDSWLIWNLSGGTNGGIHVTDVTNASRTMLLDLHTLEWSPEIAADMGIPLASLPMIKSSSEVYGYVRDDSLLHGVPIAAALGDQQAATFGQACFAPGDVKNTYGTGCFMLMNTGNRPVASTHGLLTTLCYQLGDAAPVYALEGSIAVAGSLVQWLRDNLGLIDSSAEIQTLAATVADNGGCYFVPAFSGLFAPHWRSDARGVIVGLTSYINKGHIARAVEEATAYQTREVVEAMEADSGVKLNSLKVDGGMTFDDLLMQFQADQLKVPVVRPVIAETTALGAAYAAGIAVGYWKGTDEVAANWAQSKRWVPQAGTAMQEKYYQEWKKAVTKSLGWVTLPPTS